MTKWPLLILIALFNSDAMASSSIELNAGINRLDLNHDGRQDYVVVSIYDRNMSYSNNTLTFFIRLPNDELGIISTTAQDSFTWLDHRIFSGAITVLDNRLFEAEDEILLVIAKKHAEHVNVFGPGPFTFEIYGIREFSQHPGAPLHEWSLLKTFESAEHYLSSEQAYGEIDTEALDVKQG